MDKTVVLAVAGSGKTTHLVNALDLTSRSVILTYTENNCRNLEHKIKRKFGYFPNNITLSTYFRFLYSFCFRPFLLRETKAKGLHWDMPPPWTMRIARDRRDFYFDSSSRLYHNRAAKFLEAQGVLGLVNQRIEKYCDNLFIDEVQDFGGNDFEFLCSIAKANVNQVFVGDFFQHTYDTSRDGGVNRTLHDDQSNYVTRFEQMGMTVDSETLNKSYRCSPAVCRFISDRLDIQMESHRDDDTCLHVCTAQAEADHVFESISTVKLFYQEHYKYNCLSRNWGDCKGEDQYNDVCVVLNKTTWGKFESKQLDTLRPLTRNKLYVACSRARGDLTFVPECLYAAHKDVSQE